METKKQIDTVDSTNTAAGTFKESTDNLRKGGCDDRDFRYVLLNNNLKCMLISDRESQKAAATLIVASGNLNDPPEVSGLAHFCEHMLFLGTEKYPEENYYSKLIAKGGGTKNAATSEDYTQFYFDIKNESFEDALDSFS